MTEKQRVYETLNNLAITNLKESGGTNTGNFKMVLDQWSNDSLLMLAMFLSEEVQKRIDQE